MAATETPFFIPIRTRRPTDMNSISSVDSTYGSVDASSTTHDISRVNYHVKHLDSFVQTLQESASRAFPNRGRSFQRYRKVQALLLHWTSDDLFVLPELEDLEKCLREDYCFETDVFSIPSENPHLELMLKICDLIKKHESEDTLFVVYYGGHARIDESRQSTWCATRNPGAPSLQWSAIQTLLERSVSDALILLDCCAGAASATFPNGKSITETISASSWNAIAPDPGRYSFTNTLIEVLTDWRTRAFSAAMLHAELLARLKHPRPIMIDGKHSEARSTPVHFMMTSNHKAPSIEFSRVIPQDVLPPSPPADLQAPQPHLEPSTALQSTALQPAAGRFVDQEEVSGPTIDEPHVMISLALEDDQRLDLNAWEKWLAGFPAFAKHVKVQGVFRSHSTLLLLSLPVMVWDLLPEDPACSFIAFIRSDNLAKQQSQPAEPVVVDVAASDGEVEEMTDGDEGEEITDGESEETADGRTEEINDIRGEEEIPDGGSEAIDRGDTDSFISGTTYLPNEDASILGGDRSTRRPSRSTISSINPYDDFHPVPVAPILSYAATRQLGSAQAGKILPTRFQSVSYTRPSKSNAPSRNRTTTSNTGNFGALSPELRRGLYRTSNHGQTQRGPSRERHGGEEFLSEGPTLKAHAERCLFEYFQEEPNPDSTVTHFLASNLGIAPADIDLWFHLRRQEQVMANNLQNLDMRERPPRPKDGARMILPGYLHELLDIFPTKQVLVIDLRSPASFEKSHIHEAINLRAPVNFVQAATLDMIKDTVTDDQNRRGLAKWKQSRCVVFYDRVVEFSWECPVADALYEKFRAEDWAGQCFILKGHYHEFSSSFAKYIGGNKMTREAKDYVDGLRQKPPPPPTKDSPHPGQQATEERYREWLTRLENEDRLPTELIPSRKAQRILAVNAHQQELESELEMHFPDLYQKAEAMRLAPPAYIDSDPQPARHGHAETPEGSVPPRGDRWEKGKDSSDGGNGDFDAKASLVEPLSSGLAKMQKAAGFAPSDYANNNLGGNNNDGNLCGHPYYREDAYSNKLEYDKQHDGNKHSAHPHPHHHHHHHHQHLQDKSAGGEHWVSDDYDEIEKDETLKNDPAFQRAGSWAARDGAGDDACRKGSAQAQQGSSQSFWKRLRPSAK